MVGKRFVPTRTPEPILGARILGLKIDDEFEIAHRLNTGLPTTAIGRLARELDVTDKQVLIATSIPESTFHAHKRDGKPLSADASSRVYRLARAAEAAEAYFEGDKAAARHWLTHPKLALDGATPLEFARTPEGSDYVIKLLHRMEHGVIS